jgi:AmmeMemoRadiSam system protein A
MPDVEHRYSEQQRAALLNLARQTIAARLGLASEIPCRTSDPALLEPRGVFVTLRKAGQLRGCIGQIESLFPLWDTVPEMAIAAAFQDPRFPPLHADEMSEVNIEISILAPLSRVTDPNEIEIGRHGLVVEKGGISGLLLPQVASSRNWDTLTFLGETCLKAGLSPDAWKSGAALRKFEAEVFEEAK